MDWLRRLLDAAPRAAEAAARDAFDASDASVPADTTSTPVDPAPASTVIAEFESASIEINELDLRAAPATDPGWTSAARQLEGAVALDAGRGVIPATQLSTYRAMIAYGQGDIPMALEHIAAARSVAEGDFEQAALDTLYAQVLAGSGSDESDRATAQALDHLAALSETGGAETEGAVVRSVLTLAGIELRNDHVTQALDIYESGLRMLAPDSHAHLDIALLAADVEARSRRPGASLERLASVLAGAGERTDWLRLELVRARAELAAGRPAEAIRITSGVLDPLNQVVPGSGAGFDPVELEALAREVRGHALAVSMLHTGALDDFDRARALWSSRHDAEGVGRALVAAATVQLRGRGDLNQARQFLDGLASSAPPVGGDAWTDGQLRRAEWYARTENATRAGEIVDETLRASGTSPGRRIRASLAGLAIGAGTDAARYLEALLEALRSVTVGSTRLAFLEGIESVGDLAAGVAGADLGELRSLATSTDGLATTTDETLAQLRIVEVERVTGDRDAARGRLRTVLEPLEDDLAFAALGDAIAAALRLDDSRPRARHRGYHRARAPRWSGVAGGASRSGRGPRPGGYLARTDRSGRDDARRGRAGRRRRSQVHDGGTDRDGTGEPRQASRRP